METKMKQKFSIYLHPERFPEHIKVMEQLTEKAKYRLTSDYIIACILKDLETSK